MKNRIIAVLALCLAPLAGCAADAASSEGDYDTEICPSCSESDFVVAITAEAGLGANMSLVYQSRSESWSCTDLTWDMLSPKRVPEQYNVELEPKECSDGADGERRCVYAFNDQMGDGCESTIQHIYVAPTDEAGSAESWAYLSFTERDSDASDVQVVKCREAGGVINCGNDLVHYTAGGRARLQLVWAE
jgi:hypothetical protein